MYDRWAEESSLENTVDSGLVACDQKHLPNTVAEEAASASDQRSCPFVLEPAIPEIDQDTQPPPLRKEPVIHVIGLRIAQLPSHRGPWVVAVDQHSFRIVGSSSRSGRILAAEQVNPVSGRHRPLLPLRRARQEAALDQQASRKVDSYQKPSRCCSGHIPVAELVSPASDREIQQSPPHQPRLEEVRDEQLQQPLRKAGLCQKPWGRYFGHIR